MSDASGILTPEGGRVGTMQHFYYGIVEEAFVECVALSAEQNENPTWVEPGSIDWIEALELERGQFAASIRCIVFAGMCLEAAIYDYAAWHLPEVVVDGLDKMDFLAKWRIIPLLVAQHEIPAGQLTHNALKALQGYRNKLVHAKSEGMKFGDGLEAQLAKRVKDGAAIASGYLVAMEAIIAASIELDLHASRTVNPLPHFIPIQGDWARSVERARPEELAPLIAKCWRSLGHT